MDAHQARCVSPDAGVMHLTILEERYGPEDAGNDLEDTAESPEGEEEVSTIVDDGRSKSADCLGRFPTDPHRQHANENEVLKCFK